MASSRVVLLGPIYVLRMGELTNFDEHAKNS